MPPDVQQAMEVQLALWQAQLALAKEKPWLAGYLLRQSVRLRERLARMSRRLLVLLSLACSRRWWQRFRKALPSLVAGSALLLALGLNAPSAGAANILVTTTADTVGDDGVTSLREAITLANANPGEDTIDLTTVSGTIGLGSDLPYITESAQFNGPGPDNLSIDGGGGYEGLNGLGMGTNIGVDGLTITNAFDVGVFAGNSATVSNSTISGSLFGVYSSLGSATVTNSTVTGRYAWGIVADGGDAIVTNSTVTGDYGGVGSTFNATVTSSTVSGSYSGVFAFNDATVTNSSINVGDDGVWAGVDATVTSSTINGGDDGVWARGDATVSNSTVSGDDDGVWAGGDATVIDSTVTGGDDDGVYASNNATVTHSTVSGDDDGVYAYYGNATVSNSTISGGDDGVYAYYGNATVTNSTVSGDDDGVYAYYGNATVTNSTVTGGDIGVFDIFGDATVSNSTVTGGDVGVWAFNDATVTNSTVTGDYLGLYARNEGTVTNSTVTGRDSGVVVYGHARVTRSTVTGTYGHGVYVYFDATVTNSTISGCGESGIKDYSGTGTIQVSHSTISGNDGYGINVAGTVFLDNSIVAGNNSGGPDLLGPFDNTTSGYNLIGNGDGSGLTHGVNGNQVGTTGALLNPMLGGLADNGGPTWTHALSGLSPAIDAANPATCLPTDQRGYPRPHGPACDIGSFEYGDLDTDGDGVSDFREQGPNKDDPGYDGNGDRIADWEQDNVASFSTFATAGDGYVSLEVPPAQRLSNPRALRSFETPPPPGVSFPYSLFSFRVKDVDPGGETTVTFHLDGLPPQTYYKYGPTPDDPSPHWYEFFYDGVTGVKKVEDTMVLHLVDGARGDHDLAANGEIVDPGGPAAIESREVLNFPYIAITEGSDTELSIINGEHYKVSGNVTYYGEDGELVGMYLLSVEAKGKVSLTSQGAIVPGATSGVVNADGRLAGYTRYLSPEGKMCSWPGSRTTATSIAVPHCGTGTEWRTGLALFNPNPEEVLVSIGLDSGEELELDLGAREQELVWLEGTECATRITATGRISAVEMFDSLVAGGDLAAVLLEGTSSSSLYIPTISFAEGSFTGVGLLNGSWDSATMVTGTRAGGAEDDVNLGVIEAQSQMAVDLSSTFSPDTLYAETWGDVVEVTPMGTPVAVYQGLVSYGEGGTEKLGSVKLNALSFTEGFLGVASSELAPTFGLVNPGAVDATVAVTARDGAGTVVSTSTLEIPAGSNLTGLVSDLLGDASLDEVSHIQLQSDVEIYGLETSYPDTRREILPVLVTE